MGGHWQNNLNIQALTLHTMIKEATANSSAQFVYSGVDEQIAASYASGYTKYLFANNSVDFDNDLPLWSRATTEIWNPLTPEQFRVKASSRDEEFWKPGPITARTAVTGMFSRGLPWVTLGLWDVHAGIDRSFMLELYQRIPNWGGGWRGTE